MPVDGPVTFANLDDQPIQPYIVLLHRLVVGVADSSKFTIDTHGRLVGGFIPVGGPCDIDFHFDILAFGLVEPSLEGYLDALGPEIGGIAHPGLGYWNARHDLAI